MHGYWDPRLREKYHITCKELRAVRESLRGFARYIHLREGQIIIRNMEGGRGDTLCSRNRGRLPLVEDLSTTVLILPSRSAHKE